MRSGGRKRPGNRREWTQARQREPPPQVGVRVPGAGQRMGTPPLPGPGLRDGPLLPWQRAPCSPHASAPPGVRCTEGGGALSPPRGGGMTKHKGTAENYGLLQGPAGLQKGPACSRLQAKGKGAGALNSPFGLCVMSAFEDLGENRGSSPEKKWPLHRLRRSLEERPLGSVEWAPPEPQQ